MRLTENIKTALGSRALRKKSKQVKRRKIVCNLKDAKNIGVLYNATHMVSFEIIKDLVKSLSSKNVNVSALGYVHSKMLIDHYLYRKGFDFFTRNDLNWYYKPAGQVVDEFIQTPFDILIDLSLEDYYPIQYILASSVSTFKVGRYTPDQQYLDLMIDLEKEKQEMKKIHEEVTHKKEGKSEREREKEAEIEEEVEQKVEIEIQLNFLINQLTYYLSLIKNT